VNFNTVSLCIDVSLNEALIRGPKASGEICELSWRNAPQCRCSSGT